MAILLRKYNPYSATEVDAYCVIDWFETFDKRLPCARFVVQCYPCPCTRDERRRQVVLPFAQQVFEAADALFDAYFAPEALQQANPPTDQFRQAYLFVKRPCQGDTGQETNPWAAGTDL